MRFVGLEDVTERLQYWSGGFSYIEVPTDYAVEQMESLPFFELVTCKECKWWDSESGVSGYCHAAKHRYRSGGWEIDILRRHPACFYCADAERRTDDTD